VNLIWTSIIQFFVTMPYDANRTRPGKILNPEYSQKEGRGGLFERRYG
jgi:hypothetical protein